MEDCAMKTINSCLKVTLVSRTTGKYRPQTRIYVLWESNGILSCKFQVLFYA